jgi:hypothetical protein
MRDLSSAIEQFLQLTEGDCRPRPDDRQRQRAGAFQEYRQRWIDFCEKVLTFPEQQPLTQMILDARWWLRAELKGLQWGAKFSDGNYDPSYEIRRPAATVAMMMLALSGRRLTWLKGIFRFMGAFVEAMERSQRQRALPLPPENPDQETALEFVRALAPDVMRIYLDEGGAIRGRRRARRR